MDAQEKQRFAARLQDAITATEKDIAALTELTRPIAPDNAIGRLSRLEAMNTKSINEAALHSARNKLGKLKYTLNNLDSDEFGICAECGEPIPPARILAMPESNRCVACAD